MTQRIDYRERVALTPSENDTVISAIETWVSNAPPGETRRFPYYQRHREQGETEIHVIVQGIDYTDIPGKIDAIGAGLNSLPGNWPDPSENNRTRSE